MRELTKYIIIGKGKVEKRKRILDYNDKQNTWLCINVNASSNCPEIDVVNWPKVDGITANKAKEWADN